MHYTAGIMGNLRGACGSAQNPSPRRTMETVFREPPFLSHPLLNSGSQDITANRISVQDATQTIAFLQYPRKTIGSSQEGAR